MQYMQYILNNVNKKINFLFIQLIKIINIIIYTGSYIFSNTKNF